MSEMTAFDGASVNARSQLACAQMAPAAARPSNERRRRRAGRVPNLDAFIIVSLS
jgi:hypothetical protein